MRSHSLAPRPGRWQGGHLPADPPDDAPGQPGPEEPFPALPPWAPQPWWVHWAACTLAIFLVVLPFSLRNLGLGLLAAGVLGAIAMPFTQRIEARHLAEREQGEDDRR